MVFAGHVVILITSLAGLVTAVLGLRKVTRIEVKVNGRLDALTSRNEALREALVQADIPIPEKP